MIGNAATPCFVEWAQLYLLEWEYIDLQYGVFKKYIIIPILPTGIN